MGRLWQFFALASWRKELAWLPVERLIGERLDGVGSIRFTSNSIFPDSIA
jgi:hypothetical protein